MQKQIVLGLACLCGVASSYASDEIKRGYEMQTMSVTDLGLRQNCSLSFKNQSADRARCFYVDSSNNKHIADGSREYPFKTLDDLRNVQFLPGDSIFLSGNQTLNGSIQISGIKASPDLPVVITSYGEGQSEIYSDASSAIILDACEHIHIKDVAVKGKGRKNGNQGSGIEVIDSRGVQINDVEASGYLMDGIRIIGGENIRITHAYVHDNGYNGIEVTGRPGEKPLCNVYVGYCVAENNPGCPAILDNHSGSGILVGYASHVIVEYCEAMENGWDMPRSGNGPVGIWGYETDYLTIQYCYSHDNKTSGKGNDGGGFDFDGGITHSLMQYNLSVNNEGAGYGLFQYGGASEWSNNVIRYNVSIDDGRKNSQAGIYVWCEQTYKDSPLKDTRIYGNLIVNKRHSISFITAYSSNLRFENNKFLLTESGTEHIRGDETVKSSLFKGNCFWTQKTRQQPKEVLDKEAVYEKIDYLLPAEINVLQIKRIVSDMIFGKD